MAESELEAQLRKAEQDLMNLLYIVNNIILPKLEAIRQAALVLTSGTAN